MALTIFKVRFINNWNQCKRASSMTFSSKPSSEDWVPEEKVTHTGQKWDKDDYRLSRFVDRPKHVNPNFAIKLIDEIPPEKKKDRIVSCDGGGPLGHPKVYINLDKPGNHTCGYCGLRFYKENH
ncbi:hypothetical protein LSTR_LSTR004814 [Laodelphax striatellus]|uniref:Zinc finger CHCC-type domain-containing protein n=1 Tax=Laodelphax striatellus TaxID=195883 RepID=A0A482WI51_LAOST|nr:hypothetical protein LSTR_LSTR004814 [Laodelphax striatellus]